MVTRELVRRVNFIPFSGFQFVLAHGDGAIALTGYHNVPEWGTNGLIGYDTGSFTSAKGGAYTHAASSVSSSLSIAR